MYFFNQKFRELRRLQEEKEGSSEPSPDPVKETEENQEEKTEPSGLSSLAEELELYKLKAREWEFKVEEVSEVFGALFKFSFLVDSLGQRETSFGDTNLEPCFFGYCNIIFPFLV